MVDPLAQVVTMLQPGALYAKIATASGPWRFQSPSQGAPFYCAVVEGSLRLEFEGEEERLLQVGDFVLSPSVHDCVMRSVLPAGPEHEVTEPHVLPNGEYRVGRPEGPHDVRLLIGYCVFGSADASLLVSLLPRLVTVSGEERLSTLVRLVVEETRAQRPARDIVLARLLEVLFIEAFRSSNATAVAPGLMRGLSDERVAVALRAMHAQPAQNWTVPQLAEESALSRSAFFERFQRAIGVAPMEYLLNWRMALAKSLLRRREGNVAQVAERVGYGSASTFSTAFRRHAGLPPAQFARAHGEASA